MRVLVTWGIVRVAPDAYPPGDAGLGPIPRMASALSVVTVLCATIASITTLVWSGTFPEPPPLSAAARDLLGEHTREAIQRLPIGVVVVA
jgi:hypothetical protein